MVPTSGTPSTSLPELISAARDLARRNPELDLVARLTREPSPSEDLLRQAQRQVDTVRRQTLQGRARLEEELLQARQGLDEAETNMRRAQALERASRTLDEWLGRGASMAISARVDEGRASLWRHKLERMLRDRAAVRIADKGDDPDPRRRLVVATEWMDSVRADLNEGVKAWVTYAIDELQRDLSLQAWQLWHDLECELPADNPLDPERGALRGELRLRAPWEYAGTRDWWSVPTPPSFDLRLDRKGFWGELWRNVRAYIFPFATGLAMLGFIQDRAMAMKIAIPTGLAVAIFVVIRDQKAQTLKALQEGERSLQEEVVRWADTRLERTRNRVRDHLQLELQTSVRPRWIAWYRAEVMPRRVLATERLEASRERLKNLQESLRKQGAEVPMKEYDLFLRLVTALLG